LKQEVSSLLTPTQFPHDVTSDDFTVVKVEVVVFWVVGYQRFGETWRWRQHSSPKRWYPTTTLHGATTQRTTNSISLRYDKCSGEHL